MQDRFDLNKAVVDWRGEMLGKLDSRVVEELERHLIDSFESHIRANETPRAAFAKARADFGEASSLKEEFSKLPAASTVNRKLVAVLFLAVSMLNLCALVGARVMPFSNEIMSWLEVGQRILDANPLRVIFETGPGTIIWLVSYLILMVRYLGKSASRRTRILCSVFAIIAPVVQLWNGQSPDQFLSVLLTGLLVTIGAPFLSFYVALTGVHGEFFVDAEATVIAYGWWGLLWWVLLLREWCSRRWISGVRERVRARFAS